MKYLKPLILMFGILFIENSSYAVTYKCKEHGGSYDNLEQCIKAAKRSVESEEPLRKDAEKKLNEHKESKFGPNRLSKDDKEKAKDTLIYHALVTEYGKQSVKECKQYCNH